MIADPEAEWDRLQLARELVVTEAQRVSELRRMGDPYEGALNRLEEAVLALRVETRRYLLAPPGASTGDP